MLFLRLELQFLHCSSHQFQEEVKYILVFLHTAILFRYIHSSLLCGRAGLGVFVQLSDNYLEVNGQSHCFPEYSPLVE